MTEPPSCRVCKSRCTTSLATGMLFGIYFQPCFVPVTVTNCMNLLIVSSFVFVAISSNALCVCFDFSYIDHPLQYEIGVQLAHYRRHCDLPRSWRALHYGGQEGMKDIPDWMRWMGSFHHPHASHWGWIDQLLLQKTNSKSGCYLHELGGRRWWGPTWWSPLPKEWVWARMNRPTSGTNLLHVMTTSGCHSWPAWQGRMLTAMSWYVT